MGERWTGALPARAAAIGALALGLSGCWLQPGQNAGHTWSNPAETELTAANVAGLDEVWSMPVAGAVGEPIVSGDRVYVTRVATGGAGPSAVINAFYAPTGAPLWSDALVNAPSGGGSTVQVLPPAHIGDALWTGYTIDEERPMGPACRGERVRFDPVTGAYTGEEDGFGSTAVASGDLVIQRQATIDAACGDDTSAVVVRDRTSLAPIWQAPLPGIQAADGEVGPTVVGDRLVVLFDDTLQGFALAGCGSTTCSPAWSVTVPFGTIPVGPAVAGPGGRSLVVQYDILSGATEVVAYSAATGAVDWRAPLGAGFDGTTVRLAVSGGSVYAAVPDGATRQLTVFAGGGCGAATCSPVWTASTPAGSGGAVASGPVVAGGVVYVPDADGIHAFPAAGCGAATCTEIATAAVDGVATAVIVSGGVLYAVTSTGTLSALAPT